MNDQTDKTRSEQTQIRERLTAAKGAHIELDTNAKFTQYLNIVNRAIGENRDQFPYDQLVSAGESLLGDKHIGVAIYEGDADSPHDYFTIELEGDTFSIVEHGKEQPDIDWRVSEEHLENVILDPQTYVDSPIKLDLDWLKTRLSLT